MAEPARPKLHLDESFQQFEFLSPLSRFAQATRCVVYFGEKVYSDQYSRTSVSVFWEFQERA